MKVSVCIVTYNHDRYIHDCLASVVGQRIDAELEILVGDDCSSDQTRDVIEKYAKGYPGLVRPVFHEQKLGGSSNYQALIRRASGDFIAHLDGDDYWLPGKLAEQVVFLERERNCVAVYTNAIVVSDHGQLIARFNGIVPERFDMNYLVRRGNFLHSSSLMYRARCREPLLEVRGAALDYQFHILLAGQGKLGYINRALAVYRRRSATSMLLNDYPFVLELYWKAILCAWSTGAARDAVRGCALGLYQNIFRQEVLRGRLKDAWRWGEKMTRECPWVSRGLLIMSVLLLPVSVGKRVLRRLAQRLLTKGGIYVLYDR